MGLGSRTGETTQPAARSGGADASEASLTLCWLFPELAWAPLTVVPQKLGRSGDCVTVLRGSEASRHHAEVWLEGPIGTIRDLSSRNGVFVNGKRIDLAPLGVGDVVRVGEWVEQADHGLASARTAE
jgi:hypothetical protein